MSDTDGYNGWRNRATWAANLHLSNDQGLWLETLRRAEDVLTEDTTPTYEVAEALQSWVKDELLEPDYWQDVYGNPVPGCIVLPDFAWSMLRDIGDPDDIDWHELAESVLEAVKDGASA